MAASPMVIPIPRARELTPAERLGGIRGSVKETRTRMEQVSQHAASHWIVIGKSLAAAKQAADECGHGPFEKWFPKSDKETGDESLFPFSHGTGSMLMAVSRFFGDFNSVKIKRLPPSWGTLYILTLLPPERIAALIESGDIHPMMTRANAAALRGPKPKKARKEKAPPDPEAEIELAHAIYRRIPKKRRLAEIVALINDCGITPEELQEALRGN